MKFTIHKFSTNPINIIMKSFFTVFVAIWCALTLFSCGESQKNETNFNYEHSDIDDNQASEILANYLKIKDALVQSESEAANKAAKNLVSNISNNQSELLNNILEYAKHIAKSNDIEYQRGNFKGLSETIYKWVKETNKSNQKLYKQFCPMAFNNEGAYWLSAEKEVYNPYYGDKMLHCGSVKEEL
ncbi:MAG: DUF3347 domain-containing protein [Cytophagales bacterium]